MARPLFGTAVIWDPISVDGPLGRNRTLRHIFFARPGSALLGRTNRAIVRPVEDVKLLLLKLRRLLYSRGQNNDDTDDLIQEAFLRLQQYHRERTVNHPEAFLVRTVLNLLTDRRRHGRTAATVPDALETLDLVDPNPTPDVALEGQKRLQHFKEGLRSVSPRQREVFILHRIEGYSFAQIAQRLGITVSMAEKHAARALLYLSDWMDEDEGDRE